MRISTSMIHNNAIRSMQKQQAAVSKSQNEVSSGKRVQSPADDPIAATRILQVNQTTAQYEQYGKNISGAETRLSLEEQALSDAQDAIQRVRELALQSNDSSLSDTDRKSIASELKELKQELVDIGNRQDSNGEYLFSGYATSTKPFSLNGNGDVVYSGDQGTRRVQTGPSQYVTDSDNGFDLFMNISSGNGTFAAAATAGNTGTGVIDAGSVTDKNAWVADDYTISFTTATDWEITDGTGTVVGNGTYTAGSAIAFNGVQVTVSGTPAAGDSFSVSPSSAKDVFSTVGDLIDSLTDSQESTVAQAEFQNEINSAISQLDQTEDQFLTVRTTVGARLSTLENVESTRQDYLEHLSGVLSNLEDADTAESTVRYTQEYTALQATQQAYAKIAQLSLFDYL